MPETFNIQSQKLYSGAAWSWMETPSLYPASHYDLNIILKLANHEAINMAGVAADNSFRFTMASNLSAIVTSGNYAYQIIATRKEDGEVNVIGGGVIEINSLLTSAGYDPRGYWQRVYEKFQTAYLLAAERGWAELEINGRRIIYSRETLLKEMQNAELKAKQERASESGSSTRKKILTRFV